MSCLLARDNAAHRRRPRRAATPVGAFALTLLGLLLSDPARGADGSENPAPASTAPRSWSSTQRQAPEAAPGPAVLLGTMANHLEQQPDEVVLRFESMPIT